VPKCQKIRKGGLDQYGVECFGRLILPQSEKSVRLKRLNQEQIDIINAYYNPVIPTLEEDILRLQTEKLISHASET